jgi:nitrate reductase beta subunit
MLAYACGSPNWMFGLSGISCYTPRLMMMSITQGDFAVVDASRASGVEVQEFIHRLHGDQLFITYISTFTRACVFCAGRVKQGMAPACVQHCMANILTFGKLDDLRQQIPEKRKAILWTKG